MCRKSYLSIVSLAFLFFSTYSLQAQEVWDLEKCVQFAQQNSLQVKQSNLAVRNANLTQKQAEFDRYPTLNGSGGANASFGRTIDPATNQFVSQNFVSNSFSLNAGVTLYNGGRITNTISRSRLDAQAAKKDAEAAVNDLSLSVASSYLSILLAEEQLETAQQRLSVSQEQLERTDRLIQAGALPKNDRLDFVAQIARDEQAIVNARNSVEINYLNLKQLMELAPDFELKIEEPTLDITENTTPVVNDLRTVYNQALSNQPQIQAGELRTQSAQLDIEIARAGKLPSISLFGNVNTFWSSAAKEFIPTGEFGKPDESQILLADGGILDILIPNPEFESENIPYFTQLNNNFGQGLGININVPIFNQYRNDINIQRAELGVQQQAVQNDQVKQQLKTNIQRSIADARAAEKSLEAAERTIEATRQAYENAQKRFDLGAINAFELTTAKNNFDNAEIDLISAKYQYLFNTKVVEFYQGKELNLK